MRDQTSIATHMSNRLLRRCKIADAVIQHRDHLRSYGDCGHGRYVRRRRSDERLVPHRSAERCVDGGNSICDGADTLQQVDLSSHLLRLCKYARTWVHTIGDMSELRSRLDSVQEVLALVAY